MLGDWRVWCLIVAAVFIWIWFLCQNNEIGEPTSFGEMVTSFLEQRYHDRKRAEERLDNFRNGDMGNSPRSQMGSRGAQEIRVALEEIYDANFPPAKLSFLRDPNTKEYIPLDCYNEELKIGARYLGIEHWHWPNFTGSTEDQHEYQMDLDELVVDMCDDNGVYLITVPYEVHRNDIYDFVEYYIPENVQAREDQNDFRNFMEV